ISAEKLNYEFYFIKMPLGVAIPLEWLLGFYFKVGTLGVWGGLACGVACCAILLILRLRVVAQRFRGPTLDFMDHPKA
ncbi:MAG: hypothetical protein WCI18_14215, partial [Pseudomonadota bacterium]